MENKLAISLIGGQTEVFDALLNSSRNVIAVLPIGSGKSFLASILLPIAATTPHMHMNRDIVYVAPNYGMLERIIWKPLKDVCMNHYGLKDENDINNSKKIITFPNGIRILCLSAEAGLKGINASLIVADEAAEFSEESLQELSNRIRPVPGQANTQGRLILISTPEGKNVYYDMYQMALAHPEKWIAFHKTYKQMASQSRSWVEEQRYLLSPLKFKKDLECDWGSVTDAFFSSWNNKYLTAHNEDRNGQLYTFHDFNKRLMGCVVAQVVGDPNSKDGRIEVLKSYAIPDCGTEKLAKAVREDFPLRIIHSVMDMSGSQINRDTTSQFGVTDKSILESYGFRIVNARKSNPLVSDTDNSCNAFLNQGRLSIPATETKLIDALETYHYEDETRKKLVKYNDVKYAHIDSLGDCIRYGVHHLFPMRNYTNDLSMPEYLDSDNRHYKAPGSDYEIQEAFEDQNLVTARSIIKSFEKDSENTDEYWG